MRARPTLLLLLPVLTAGMCTAPPIAEVDPYPMLGASFEEGSLAEGSGMPTTVEVWTGAVVEVVGAENGVSPADGSHMLAFRASAPDEINADQYLPISMVRSVRQLEYWHSDEEFLLEVSFAASAQTADRYNGTLEVWFIEDGTTTDLEDPETWIILGHESITGGIQRDWSTWSLSSTVPDETAAIVIGLSVEDPDGGTDRSVQQTFEGVYADEVVLRIREHRPI